MSWTSRFGNLGRFSPFSRSPPQGSAKVSDADFSYITSDDLKKHHAELNSHGESPADFGPPRDTDVLVLRNKKKEYAVHFPAYSIVKGELTIGQVREQAAKKIGAADQRRIKLVHKGKSLRDDSRTCKQEGLKDGAVVLCTSAEAVPSASEDDDDDDDDFGDLDGGDQDPNGEGRKRRNRGKKSKKRNKREQQRPDGNDDNNLGVPPGATRAPSPRPGASPATPLDKLNAIGQTLKGFEAEAENYRVNPPPEATKREFEYKRLSESVLAMVLLKLDGVETEGDNDARMRRKELVRDAQAVLQRLDEAHKP